MQIFPPPGGTLGLVIYAAVIAFVILALKRPAAERAGDADARRAQDAALWHARRAERERRARLEAEREAERLRVQLEIERQRRWDAA